MARWCSQVAPCSAASAAGLRPNDVIVAIDGSPIPAAAALTADVAGRHPGEMVTLHILRPGPSNVAQLTFTVSLGGTQSGQLAQPPQTKDSLDEESAMALDAVKWTGFTDPNEQDFSVEVPAGRGVVGGLLRHTAANPSIYLPPASSCRRTAPIPRRPLSDTSSRPPVFNPAWLERQQQATAQAARAIDTATAQIIQLGRTTARPCQRTSAPNGSAVRIVRPDHHRHQPVC